MNEYEISANVYKKIISINNNRSDAYLKVADIYFNHLLGKKQEALDFLNNGLKSVFDEEPEFNKCMVKCSDSDKESLKSELEACSSHWEIAAHNPRM